MAGCRIVVDGVGEIHGLSYLLARPKTRIKVLDYIQRPKNSGYHDIHVVYRLGAPSYGHDNLKVEIQIRSRSHHAWATTVEAYNIAHNTDIEVGLGTDEQNEYFSLAFRPRTKGPGVEEKATIGKRLRSLDEELDVFGPLYETSS